MPNTSSFINRIYDNAVTCNKAAVCVSMDWHTYFALVDLGMYALLMLGNENILHILDIKQKYALMETKARYMCRLRIFLAPAT